MDDNSTIPSTVLFVNTRPTALEAFPCFYAARQLGLDVVLLTDRPTGVAAAADEVVLVDTYDLDALEEQAVAVAGRRPVAGAVTWADRDVEGVARITDRLGLPGHPPAAAATARNKGRLRAALRELAPDLVPAFHVVRSDADLAEALARVPLPAILKPTGASGSKGIFAIEDEASLRAAYARLMEFTHPDRDPIFRYYPGELVLEERIFGSEHSVEGIVQDGRPAVSVVTDKWVRLPYFLEHLQVQPTRLPASVERQVLDAADRAVRGVGLRDGAFHLELKLTPDGRPVVLELNARTGGGYITSHMIPLSTGYDFYRQVLRAACGLGEVALVPPPFCAAGSVQVITGGEGEFGGFPDLGRALDTPGVLHFAYELAPGSPVIQPPRNFTSPVLASLVARGLTPEGVEKVLRQVDATLEPVLR